MKPVSSRSSLFANTVRTAFVRFAGLALAFVASVIISRALGPEQRGIYAALAGIAGLATQIANLGLQGAFTYFGAKQPSWARGLATLSLGSAFVLGGLSIGAVVSLFSVRADYFGQLPLFLVLIATLVVPFNLAVLFVQNLLLGWGDVFGFNALDAANKLLSSLILPLLVLSIPTVLMTLQSTLLVQALTAVLGMFWLIRVMPRGQVVDTPALPALFSYGLRGYLNNFFLYLLLRSDIILLNYFAADTAEMGQYSIAAQLVEILLVIPTTVGTLLFALVAAESRESAARTAQVSRTLTLVHFLAVVAAGVLSPFLVPLVFGQAYAGAVPYLWLLLPGALAFGLINPLSQDLAGRGLPWKAVWVWVPPLVLNLAFNWAFIPSMGATAAAVSSSVSYSLALVAITPLFLIHNNMRFRDLVPNVREFASFIQSIIRR